MDKTSKISKLSLGVALVMLGLILILSKNTKQSLNSSFENEPVTLRGFNNQSLAEENIPRRVIIPRLSLDLGIKKATVINGYWEVFEGVAGWGEGSGVPGTVGNQVVFAHAREGMFLPLRDVKDGEIIYILTGDGWYAYRVTEIKEVYPNQIEVIEQTSDETLTLYTCSGFRDSMRLVVTSKRI